MKTYTFKRLYKRIHFLVLCMRQFKFAIALNDNVQNRRSVQIVQVFYLMHIIRLYPFKVQLYAHKNYSFRNASDGHHTIISKYKCKLTPKEVAAELPPLLVLTYTPTRTA